MLKKPFFVFLIFLNLFSFNKVKGLEEPAKNPMQDKIEHVVILMLENRSFDNILGWLYSKEDKVKFIPSNRNEPFYGLSEDTLSQYTNYLLDSSGNIVFSSPPIKGLPSIAGSTILNSPKFDPNEPFPNVTNQIFNGGTEPTMTGFLQDYASIWSETEWAENQADICAVMETYTDKDLPVFHALARDYAVSDLWFASVPTQTNPNRAFAFCGTSCGQTVNGSFGKSDFPTDTIWNRLCEVSPETTWTIFWHSDNIPILFPGPYALTNFPNIFNIPNYQSYFKKIDKFHELARKGDLPAISFIEPEWTTSINVFPTDKVITEFVLRNQDIVLGFQGNDFHPPGDMRTGEDLLANIYTSLTSNPEAWKKTLLIVTFDEHGGLFDHVPPPSAIPPDNNFQDGFMFDRYGVRVPTILISPYIEKNTIVRSETEEIPFDHTSILATLLKWLNVDKSLWNLGQRVYNAPTFENVFTRSVPRTQNILNFNHPMDFSNKRIVHLGEKFYLKNNKGEYIVSGYPVYPQIPFAGTKDFRIPVEFYGGEGPVTHGSFALIRIHDPFLGDGNFLETDLTSCECLLDENKHFPGQWWTIKKVQNPHVGKPIKYGDKIYIENHVYLDVFQLVSSRLNCTQGYLGNFLTTEPITQYGCDKNYWIIERAE